jgi:hypothetical protein
MAMIGNGRIEECSAPIPLPLPNDEEYFCDLLSGKTFRLRMEYWRHRYQK